MKLNDEIMKETFSRFDEENDPVLYRIYGVVTATVGKMLLLGTLSSLANQYFLVGFSKTRMVMIRLDFLGNQKESSVIYYQHIQNIKITNWMFGIGKKIYIKLSDGSKIRLKSNKANAMLKKQKEYLTAACDLLSAIPSV
jgi:hypothetical protein